MKKSKKAIVTGGAGFIGSHMVDRLLADDFQVVVIDNFSTGRPENLAHHKDNPGLEIIQSDINDLEKIQPSFESADWVIHLAALADIVPSIERPLEYHHSNVSGTISVLEAARKANVKKFIYAASASCYGIPDQFPTRETAPMQPQYPYALTKYVGEQYAMHWAQVYQLPVISLRFSNIFGPRSRTSGTYGAVFGVFLAQKIKNKPYTVVGDGNQSRDFLFVTDLAEAIFQACESPLEGEIFNVGSGGHFSVNRLVELLGGPVTFVAKRPGEPDKTFSDTTKIRAALNWKPKVSFEAGVQEMIKNIDYWANAPIWTPASIKEATQTWFKYLK